MCCGKGILCVGSSAEHAATASRCIQLEIHLLCAVTILEFGSPLFVPPGPYISKYLDSPALIFRTPMHIINYSRDSGGSGARF